MSREGPMKKVPKDLSGCRILIVSGPHAGQEGICLGPAEDGKKWSVSPDDSNEILNLTFEKEFGLLLDMSGDAERN
jgi:hypothetical protein